MNTVTIDLGPGFVAIIVALGTLITTVGSVVVAIMTTRSSKKMTETHVAVNSRVDRFEASLRDEISTLKAEIARRDVAALSASMAPVAILSTPRVAVGPTGPRGRSAV